MGGGGPPVVPSPAAEAGVVAVGGAELPPTGIGAKPESIPDQKNDSAHIAKTRKKIIRACITKGS